jgi:hypothetical protein
MQTYMLTNLLTKVHYNIAHINWPKQPQLTPSCGLRLPDTTSRKKRKKRKKIEPDVREQHSDFQNM